MYTELPVFRQSRLACSIGEAIKVELVPGWGMGLSRRQYSLPEPHLNFPDSGVGFPTPELPWTFHLQESADECGDECRYYWVRIS